MRLSMHKWVIQRAKQVHVCKEEQRWTLFKTCLEQKRVSTVSYHPPRMRSKSTREEEQRRWTPKQMNRKIISSRKRGKKWTLGGISLMVNLEWLCNGKKGKRRQITLSMMKKWGSRNADESKVCEVGKDMGHQGLERKRTTGYARSCGRYKCWRRGIYI